MNKIKNTSMFLLWAGAAISISEIYTGGIIAPLGFWKGFTAILVGHLIGTGLLAFGGYISFQNKKSAMESVRDAMGSRGVKVIAFLNVLQLIGWSAIMIIQGGRALSQVFPVFSYSMALLVMAVAVFVWAYFFNNYTKSINDVSVIILIFLCFALFWRSGQSGAVPLTGTMRFATAVELSIAMPVSWLPLIGDYTRSADSKAGATHYAFWGYFIGSVMMYALGLYIAVFSGKDIIEFIAASYVKWIACIIIVLSTVTTTFLDLYSAVLSSKQIIPFEKENRCIILYAILVTGIAYIFPIEQYQNFLLTIGSVFVPVYTVIFLEYLLKRTQRNRTLNAYGMLVAAAGTLIYFFLTRFAVGIPTVLVIGVIALLYFLGRKIYILKEDAI